jgi:thiol-disulfide isomerase/thioredoxin
MKKGLVLALLIGCLAFNVNAQQKIAKWKITDVEKYMQAKNGEVLVINFWATFCKPCVAEIPSFIKISDQYKDQKVKLLLVSLDLPSYYPAKVVSFARKHDFNTNIVWLSETNADYFCPKIDKSWSGSIPATLILNPSTGYRKFFEEEISAEIFEKELRIAIDSKAVVNKKEYFIDRTEPE